MFCFLCDRLEVRLGFRQAGGATDEASDIGQGINKATAEFGGREFLGLVSTGSPFR